MTNYAQCTTRTAWLSTEFGESWARKLFGDTIIDNLPRYLRGKRKGLIKGQIEWTKCTKGGWVKTGPYDEQATGHVQARGFMNASIQTVPWGEDPVTPHSIQNEQN